MKSKGTKHTKHVILVIVTVICVLAAITALKLYLTKTPFSVGSFSFPPEKWLSALRLPDEVSLPDEGSGVTALPASQATAAPVAVTAPAPDPRFDVDTLILVNKDHPLPDGYDVVLRDWDEKIQVAWIIYRPLSNMMNAMRAEGLSPRVNSAYRSVEEQNRIMGVYIDDYMNHDGMDYETASRSALDYVSLPGLSEHGTGLAADISSGDGDGAMYAVYDWLEKNAQDYGFIKRYPAGKEAITGYAEERWHYRYVGVKTAREIYDLGVTLEEYLETDVAAEQESVSLS